MDQLSIEVEDQASTQAALEMEKLLDEYDYAPPQRGDFLEGEIIQIDEDSILVDVGTKRDAVVPRKDLNRLTEEDLSSIMTGDVRSVRVLRSPIGSGDLLVSLSKGLAREDWKRADSMLESGEEAEFAVVGRNRGGLLVRFGYLEGFVPNSHLPDVRSRRDADEIPAIKLEQVGSKLLLKVLEVDQERNRLILSGRAAEKARRQQRLQDLQPGQVLSGRVVNITDFGAFVALGGIDGLVHRSELSWDDINHPDDILDVGDEIEVKVKDVDRERERVSLSRKALLPSPWDDIHTIFTEGELAEGVVSNVVDFGAFVVLSEGIEGLIHASEIDIIGPGTPQDVVQANDTVLVRILSIEPDRHRIALSLKQVGYDEQMEWMERQRLETPVEDPDGEEASLEAEIEDAPEMVEENLESTV
jgi:small subunit ribosomal protein S1